MIVSGLTFLKNLLDICGRSPIMETMMINLLILYLVVGCIWALYNSIRRLIEYGKSPLIRQIIVAELDTFFWPISITMFAYTNYKKE